MRANKKSKNSGKNDQEWGEQATLEFGPHPELSDSQKKVIELDYCMKGGRMKIKVRKALLYYALRHLGLDTDPSAQKAPGSADHIAELGTD
jgi:hypothetical protein